MKESKLHKTILQDIRYCIESGGQRRHGANKENSSHIDTEAHTHRHTYCLNEEQLHFLEFSILYL